jgi:RNA polymerase sigma factor (sigma-70 family)
MAMKPRVLVVDDDEMIVDGLTALLQLEDYESEGACDLLSAEAMMRGSFYPVIIADVRLRSEAEGMELLDAIRRLSPRSRVISITAFSTPEIEREVKERGSCAMVTKPASGDEILEAIAGLFLVAEKLTAGAPAVDVEQLHEEVRRILYFIARKKYSLSVEEAEDAVQQTWLLFLEKQSSVTMPPAWLAGTMSNLCRRQIDQSRRSREKFIDVDAIENLATEAQSPDDRIALHQALATLDAESRDLCMMIAIEGRPYEEVSALSGLPLGSIGPMYLRAKKKMRDGARLTSH